jgi:hypothetical protein
MENVMPSFEYEPLILSLELEISDEEEDKGNTYGSGPLGIKVIKKLGNPRGGKYSHGREVVEHIIKQK